MRPYRAARARAAVLRDRKVVVPGGNAVFAGATIDLLVVGGGINGAGIARDAAGRGLSVLVCDQDDLAARTSSASTGLIHGGLRYLERFELGLVRKALHEREVLLRAAPHIVRPLRFVLPHDPRLRSAWLIRAGLFLYDRLGRRERLAGSRGIDLRRSALGAPLRPEFRTGFVYSDARVDDARLVVLNALDAAERGATVLPRTRLVSAERRADHWQATLQAAEPAPGAVRRVHARVLVNAAGPWAARLLREALGIAPHHNLLMAKGSHIVVPRMFGHDHAYVLQHPDRRVGFAIPYERDYTLVGTTDVAFDGDPARAAISSEETAYLCDMANRWFARPISPVDVVWSYAGVRPLLEQSAPDLSAVSRDYALELDAPAEGAPVLSVFGGKLTTYRRLAEEALDLLRRHLRGARPAWTARATLPGGDMADAGFDAFVAELARRYPWLPRELRERYARAYGTRVSRLLDGARALADLGRDLGGGLYEAEVDYLVKYEWARTPEDVLWRRSKLGLHAGPAAMERLAQSLPSLIRRQRPGDLSRTGPV
jgi:glycerol-3-phosphate dehydrogenase